MKVLAISKENKDFNGMPYVEFILRCIDSGVKRIVKVTGKVPVIIVDPDGETTELGRLDRCGLTPGSNVDFWFDLNNRITLIEVHSDEVAPPYPDDTVISIS